ncbi:hypothetical protein HPB52_018206 [Rhipicephalus sanguineus]|uniref:Uncharacterized protein n=1 Tax=Rhipicephalus sanguineus TaxID=34632 RepID=A0A9D4TB82_RHISA|nr:hypothetical protein HPB52_018206 [Rhipicephalus sanguineus]
MDDDEAESKKPRLEENKFDDKTSTYDFSDEEDMGEDEPFTLAARRTRLLHKCDDMNLSTEDNRAATKLLQILRFGHRNHHIKETLQENHKEYNRKTKQGCEHPRDIRQKVMDPRALMFAQAIRVKLHVVLSDPQEKYQPIPTTPVHQ